MYNLIGKVHKLNGYFQNWYLLTHREKNQELNPSVDIYNIFFTSKKALQKPNQFQQARQAPKSREKRFRLLILLHLPDTSIYFHSKNKFTYWTP